jgi:hypothetical protein
MVACSCSGSSSTERKQRRHTIPLRSGTVSPGLDVAPPWVVVTRVTVYCNQPLPPIPHALLLHSTAADIHHPSPCVAMCKVACPHLQHICPQLAEVLIFKLVRGTDGQRSTCRDVWHTHSQGSALHPWSVPAHAGQVAGGRGGEQGIQRYMVSSNCCNGRQCACFTHATASMAIRRSGVICA